MTLRPYPWLVTCLEFGSHAYEAIQDEDPEFVKEVRAAARVTRQLRLLPAHGLIYRVGRTYYYRPTQKGQLVINTALKFRQTNVAGY